MLKNHCHFKSTLIAVITLLLLFFMIGCSSVPTKTTDIITQKKPLEGRTPITVLVKYAFSIHEFEKTVEELFTDIDIVQVGNYTSNMGLLEYEKRLESDDLPDIVMTWPLDVGEEYFDERLMDLSGLDFTSKYNISMLDDISRGGKLYYLPGPAQMRGIVYNKTLFKEKGWEVPSNYDEFIALCQKIEESGIRSLQLSFANSEVLDTAFVGYNYGNFYSKPQDIQWIDQYNKGTGSFKDHFSPALDVFQDMVDAGIWQKKDLEINYADRERSLFNRECAMVEDSVLIARMGHSISGITDEFALMPFFNPGEDNDWVRLYMVCYIGLNKHLSEPQNKDKYEKVVKLMEYISTQEGQTALASDTGAMLSSLTGMSAPNISEIEELMPALKAGRYTIFPTFKNAQPALREGLAGMISGELTKEDVAKIVDEQNSNPPSITTPPIIGSAKSDFGIMQTGNFVTDTMSEWSGCEISLFLDNGKDGLYNGKGISASLYKGDISTSDITRILPDLKYGESGTLAKITMTGENLINTLEHAIPVGNNQLGWFYYFSGLKVSYDPTATPGQRIKSITTAKGEAIDPQKVYYIAVMDESIPEQYITSIEKTQDTIAHILEQTIIKKKTIAPANDGRFEIAS